MAANEFVLLCPAREFASNAAVPSLLNPSNSVVLTEGMSLHKVCLIENTCTFQHKIFIQPYMYLVKNGMMISCLSNPKQAKTTKICRKKVTTNKLLISSRNFRMDNCVSRVIRSRQSTRTKIFLLRGKRKKFEHV